MTYFGQAFCMVVYPADDNGEEEAEEMKEAKSPLSKEDEENHKEVA